MSISCSGCKHNWRVMLRRQWMNICKRTGKTPPMVICREYVPRFVDAAVLRPKMGAELL